MTVATKRRSELAVSGILIGLVGIDGVDFPGILDRIAVDFSSIF